MPDDLGVARGAGENGTSTRCQSQAKEYGMGVLDPRQYVETQRQDWNRVASAWEKWDRRLDENMAFINYRLVGDARLRPGQRVLDLGAGTGYPSALAAQAVGQRGAVVGLDLAEEMVEAARRKAKALGLSNVTFRA